MRKNNPTPMPMKLFAIFGLLAILSSSFFGSTISTVQAQEPTPPAPNGEVQPLAENGSSLYYYVDGKRVDLTPSLDWVSVKFVSADASEQEAVTGKFSSTVTSLSGAREIPHLGVTLLPVKDGLAAKSLVQGVNSMRASSSSFSQVNPVFAYDSMDMVVSDEFVAAFPPAASMAEINEINAARGVELVSEVLGQENTFVLRVTSAASLDALAMANHYQESGLVVYASPNFVRISAASPTASTEKPGTIGPMFTPDDSYYANDQWYLNGTGQYGTTVDADIDAPEAWDITTGDPSVVIAIIDEGVDITHPELTGLAKLVTGYDATGTGPAGGAQATNSHDAHGTAAAGIAAAASNNTNGISGVCQLCKIMPVRIAYGDSDPYTNVWITTDTWIANGITWAYQNGADVLSNSWGGGLPVTVVNTAITNAVTLGRGGTGAVVVFAAGNENNSSVSWPASQSNVIAVGALNICDHRKDPNTSDSCNGGEDWGSNFGSELDVMAAGMWLTTTDIIGGYGYSYSTHPDYDPTYGEDYYGYFNGTSGATPIVSGVAGLLLSINPFMDPAHVQEVLQTTADDLGVEGRDNDTGHGRVNAFKAVTLAKKPDIVITGYEFRNADSSATIPYPPSGEAFTIRLILKNRGGTATTTVSPSVFLDDAPNYGIDLDTADLGRITDFQGYRRTPSTAPQVGCLYYDPAGSLNPLTPDLPTERGNYTRNNLNESFDAGVTLTTDVYIGYSLSQPGNPFNDAIYDPIRFGLADGSYQIYLYADANCASGDVEGYEDNNSFGPISVTIPYATGCAAPMTGTAIFGDVPVGHWARQYVEALYTCGYTAGCSSSPLLYCPQNGMTRVESSVFILRGNFGASYTPPSSGGSFGDNWSQGPWGQKWAQGLLNAGLTAGCSASPLLFCPFDATPRVQLAVFGVRLRHGSSFIPPAATGTVFADMTNPAYFGTRWAEQAYADGIIPACGTSGGKPMFCPDSLVDRALAAFTVAKAKFLVP